MVFQISTIRLGIFESIDNATSDDGVLNSLVGFSFQVSRELKVVSDRRTRLG